MVRKETNYKNVDNKFLSTIKPMEYLRNQSFGVGVILVIVQIKFGHFKLNISRFFCEYH